MSSSGWKAWAVAAASCALLFGCVADEGGDGAADDGTGQPEAGIRLDMGAGGAGGEGGEGGAGGMGGQGGEGGMGGMGGQGGMGGEGGAPPPACSDGVDNDQDGQIDHPADPGCESPEDDDETDPPMMNQCADGLDNDGDGAVDLADSDCVNGLDPTEDGQDAVTACSNGLDDDQDGITDFPMDPGCGAAGDDDEADPAAPRACGNGMDDDGDGAIDFPNDPGCQGVGDPDETDPAVLPACGNGIDDDGDGATDYPADSGCTSAADPAEASSCPAGVEVIDLNAHLADNESWEGSTEGGSAALQGSCGGGAGPERVFAYRVSRELRRIAFRTDNEFTAVPTVVYIKNDCEVAEDLACNRGAGETPGTVARLDEPAQGLYYVVVDTGSRVVGPGNFRLTVEETAAPHCRDGVDNDGDGLLDLADPGCVSPDDEDEADPEAVPECADGIDNDQDGAIDYPADMDCTAAGVDRERPLCGIDFPNVVEVGQDGAQLVVDLEEGMSLAEPSCVFLETGTEYVVQLTLDDPSDVAYELSVEGPPDGIPPTVAMYLRSDCADANSEMACTSAAGAGTLRGLEAGTYFLFVDAAGIVPPGTAINLTLAPSSNVRQCNDGLDNDDDGVIDLADPGCEQGMDNNEADPLMPPACADGVDNDGDGAIDWPADAECRAAGDLDERLSCEATDDVIAVGMDGGAFDYDTADGRQGLFGSTCAGGAGSPEQVFELTLTGPARVVAEITAFAGDSALHMRTVCDDADAQVACDDDGGDGLLSRLSFNRLEAGRYFFFADGFGANRAGAGTIEFTVEALEVPECMDEADNDGDGLVDAADPGCETPFDATEADPAAPPACADMVDNDDDGLIDFPNDPGCHAAGGPIETDHCAAGLPLIEVGQAGGDFPFRSGDGGNLTRGSCGVGDGLEQVFAVTLDDPSNVTVTVTDEAGAPAPTVMYMRADCDDAAGEAACSTNGTLRGRQLDRGTWYVFIERGRDVAAPAGDWTATFAIESLITQCNDQIDNDGDMLIDFADPGCFDGRDNDETDPAVLPECADGVDNDEDGATDYPEDEDCLTAGGLTEATRCAEVQAIEVGQAGGVFNINPADAPDGAYESSCDGGGVGEDTVFALTLEERSRITVETLDVEGGNASHIVSLRSACDDPASELECKSSFTARLSVGELMPGTYFIVAERDLFGDEGAFDVAITVESLVRECNDEVDNDDDGLIDLDDPGCERATDDDETDPAEAPECSDGIDNDDDGVIDYPNDDGCPAAGDDSEILRCEGSDNVIEVGQEGGRFQGNSAGNGDNYNGAACGGGGRSEEQVFQLTLDFPSLVTAEIVAADFDTMMFARAGNCDEGAFIDCDDDGGAGLLSLLDFGGQVLEPGVYYIYADAFSAGNAGAIEVDFRIVSQVAQCNDLADNDGDGLIDLADPGCVEGLDDDEADPAEVPQCADGVDNDLDGLIDFPNDPECAAAGGDIEAPFCLAMPGDLPVIPGPVGGVIAVDPDEAGADAFQASCGNGAGGEAVQVLQLPVRSVVAVAVEGVDGAAANSVVSIRGICDDVDTQVLCKGSFTARSQATLEAGTYYVIVDSTAAADPAPFNLIVDIQPLITECNDEVDNDDDGLIDLADPGCTFELDLSEADPDVAPECADGVDNDEDGLIDFGEDPECYAAGTPSELAACAQLDEVVLWAGDPVVVAPNAEGRDVYAATCGNQENGEVAIGVQIAELSNFTVSVTDANGEPVTAVVGIRRACDVADTEVACKGAFSDAVTVSSAEPGLYYLIVDADQAVVDDITVTVDVVSLIGPCNDEVDNDEDGLIDLADPGCAGPFGASEDDPAEAPVCADGLDNDDDGATDFPDDPECQAAGWGFEELVCLAEAPVAVLVDEGAQLVLNTVGTGNDYEATCGGSARSAEQVVLLRLSAAADVTVETTNSDFDTVLYIRTVCDDAEAEIACDDDGGAGTQSLIASNLEAGDYYIFVDGFGAGDGGNTTLVVTVDDGAMPPPPAPEP